MRASSPYDVPGGPPARQDAIVAQLPESLIPSPGGLGLASDAPDRLASSVAQSWALFAAMVDDLDLDAPTRAKGLTAREILVPLGAWPDNRPLAQLLDEAQRGVVGDHDQSALVDAVRAAHADEPDHAVRDAVRRQGEEMESFLFGPEVDELGTLPVASMLGTLPVLTFLHAATYPLATAALDLESAGAQVPDALLDNGLVGLTDIIGALAARQGLTASISATTPTVTVGSGAQSGAWATRRLDETADELGPGVRGSTRLLLEVTAGRADVPGAYRRGELGVEDLTGLLALAPIVEQVPGIPGRGALLTAIRTTQALGSVLRLFGRR
jgi:hypothetical protein